MNNHQLDTIIEFINTKLKNQALSKEKLSSVFLNSYPKIIYSYWDSGLQEAPELVRFCVGQNKQLNSNYKFIFLNDEKADLILPRGKLPKNISIQQYSDALRLTLLEKSGGIWIDASAYCVRPLDYWLPAVLAQSQFFAFSHPGSDRVISNWFLAARPKSELIKELHKLFVQLMWDFEFFSPPYFIFHYLLEFLLLKEERVYDEFESMPKISAKIPHLLDFCLNSGSSNEQYRRTIQNSYVQKLSWKSAYGKKFSSELIFKFT